MRDKRIWLATAVLFVLGAWPLFLCDVPPLEDLPAHLATSVVVRHLDAYPQFVFHGFFKTNAALFLFLAVFDEARLVLAGKLFVALVVFAHAWVFPRLAAEAGDEQRVVPATLLAVPLVHNWFVAAGMLDYALGSALAMAALLLLARQSREPTRARAIAIGVLGIAIWYAHVFALAIVVLLVAVEALRLRSVRPIVVSAPLAPAVFAGAWSAIVEMGRSHGSASHGFVWRAPWESAYELWAHYAWSFSKLELVSLASTLVLAIGLLRRDPKDVAFFSPSAAIVLAIFALGAPSEAFDWFAVSSRFLPFLYAVAIVHAPTKVPRFANVALAMAAVVWSAGLALDYRRLDRDMKELAAGTSVVPEGADLLPLVFEPKGASENTWALLDGWGAYVIAKHTSAPLLYAHSPSFPIGYVKAPLDDEEPRRLASAVEHGDADALSHVAARHAWVLVWGKPPDGFSIADHRLAFERGRLRLYSRALAASER
jgi:hypothetical protein